MKRLTYLCAALLLGTAAASLSSCSSNKTYAQQLKDEKNAIKSFVKEQGIQAIYIDDDKLDDYKTYATDWRTDNDSVIHFELGQWYKFDDNLYMRINSYGDTTQMFANLTFPDIAIRFDSCYNLLTFDSFDEEPYSNETSTASAWLIEGWNTTYSSDYGEGLDFPVRFLGYRGNVSLIVPSKMGMSSDISNVIPYYYGTVTYNPSYQ